jgi:hypothetical protein
MNFTIFMINFFIIIIINKKSEERVGWIIDIKHDLFQINAVSKVTNIYVLYIKTDCIR